MRLLLILSLLVLGSCGESPLFNHQMESANGIINTSFSESDVLKFKKTGYSFTITWEEGPRLGEGRFVMKTWTKNGSLNGPYQSIREGLNVFLWMPAMGHGSVPVKIRETSPGEYKVSNVQFIMSGTWEIKFQVKQGSQVLDEVVVPVAI